VLIGYASRFGSTRDIANRIASAVRTDGNDVHVRSVDEIADLDPYDAVVFGSGVYDGSWTAEATELCADTLLLLHWRANPYGYSAWDRSGIATPLSAD
jgi:menaquinone-dependent protoporphyrinogen oxidase